MTSPGRMSRILVACVLAAAFAVLALAVAPVGMRGDACAAVAWADERQAASGGASASDQSGDARASAADNQLNPQQLPDSSFIYDTSISDLESADAYLDQQTVQVTGEVVGDRIHAELDAGHCWILLQAVDGSNAAVSVYMSTSAADLIDTYGAYGRTGTVLQVRGTFNLACRDHEGLSDLHADPVSVVSKGFEQLDEFDPAAMVPGVVMMAIGVVLILVFYRMRESRR